MPAAHALCAVLPVPVAYWPPQAVVHHDLPALGWKVPSGQGVHADAPPEVSENCPASQALCAVLPVPVAYWPPSARLHHDLAPSGWYLPASQGVHADAPLEEYSPAEQALCAVLPVPVAYWPPQAVVHHDLPV